MYMRTIGNNGCGLPKCKMEGQLIRSPTRINSFILPLSFKSSGEVLYSCSSTLIEFCDWSSTGIEVSYRQSIDLALPIDSDRLQVWLLGQSDVSFGVLRLSRCLFRTSYDWSNRLYFRSPARHRPPPHPVSIFFLCTEQPFHFSLDRTEWKHQHFFGCYCSARALLESHCQPDDRASHYSFESKDSIFWHAYCLSIQCLLNTCSHHWYFLIYSQLHSFTIFQLMLRSGFIECHAY